MPIITVNSEELDRLTARNEHLEKRFGYLEGDWERRNHIIESQAKRIEQLEGENEANADHARLANKNRQFAADALKSEVYMTNFIVIANKRIEQLEGALFGSNGALTRMDRARKILNDRHGFDNWNVLNTDDIKAAIKGDT